MINEFLEVSHLCGMPNCIEPDHLVVEPKALNESRKICQKDLFISVITINNVDFQIYSKSKCTHEVHCVPRWIEVCLDDHLEGPSGGAADNNTGLDREKKRKLL